MYYLNNVLLSRHENAEQHELINKTFSLSVYHLSDNISAWALN